MGWTNKNVYFETSAVNYLANKYKWNDAVTTKAFQSVRGNKWYLSPVTIWEILLTSDEIKKEKIIYYSQHLFFEKLLNSPSELIINFILSGCPQEEKKYDFHSNSNLQKTWQNLCSEKNKTFIYDKKALRDRTEYIQKLSKQLFSIINKVIFNLEIKDLYTSLPILLNIYIQKFKKRNIIKDVKFEKIFKLSILFIFYILCLEIDLDANPIKEFWDNINISDTGERLNYIVENYESLIYRGPFIEMALMAYNQIKEKNTSSRGLFFDCLHSIYLPYVNYFITNDDHFKNLRNNLDHLNYLKIHHINELQMKAYLRSL